MTSAAFAPSRYLAERRFTLTQVWPLLGPMGAPLPPVARAWVDTAGGLPLSAAWNTAEDAPALVWFAAEAGVKRQSILQAVTAVLRLGVEDMGTRQGQLYLGALAMVDLHLAGHRGVSAGDLGSLVMPFGDLPRRARMWTEMANTLITFLQDDRRCLSLRGLWAILAPIAPAVALVWELPPEGPTVATRAANAIREHLPWQEMVATTIWTKVDR